jgi:hypothetical protein
MKFKSIVPISLVIIPWLLFLPFLCQLAGMEALSQWLLANTVKPVYIAFPIILLLNVFCDYICPWDTGDLNRWNLLVKLLIPAYLVVFGIVRVAQAQLGILLVLCVLLLLTSSAYGLRVLFRAKKNKKIRLLPFLLLLVCHFCFVTDIIAALILRRKYNS